MKRNFLLCLFLSFSIFSEARLPDLIPYRKGNKWGYADSTRKIIIPCLYDTTMLFYGNVSIRTVCNGVHGTLLSNGTFVPDAQDPQLSVVPILLISPIYGEYPVSFVTPVCAFVWYMPHALYPASDNNGRWGYLQDGKVVIPYQFAEARSFTGGRAVVMNENNDYGFVDSTGHFYKVQDAVELNNLEGGTAIYQTQTGYGIVDKNGNVLLPPLSDFLEPYWGLIVAKNNNHAMLLNRWGKPANPMSFDQVDTCGGYFFVKHKGLCGALNKKAREVIPCKYAGLFHFQCNLAAAFDGEHWGFLTTKGKIKIPFKYPQPENNGFLPEGICFFKSTGCIDIHGTEYWEE